MRYGKLRNWSAPLLSVALMFATAVPALGQVYFKDELPEGIVTISLSDPSAGESASDGGGEDTIQTDEGEVPLLHTATPEVSGKVEPGIESVEVTIRSREMRFTIPVDPKTGEFKAVVPQALESGLHSLYVNNGLVGKFYVAEDAAGVASAGGVQVPNPAATGTGSTAPNGDGPFPIAYTLGGAMLLLAVGGLVAYRALRPNTY